MKPPAAEFYPLAATRLTNLLYEPGVPPERVAEACFEWGRGYPAVSPHRQPRRAGRLRVGYLSSNFCANPEIFFSLPLLRHHDRRRVDVYCYSNTPKLDIYTRRFRRLELHWRDIRRLSDAAATALIRRDGIDVLVDLSGHWANGRVPLLALRPAPVQISLGTYPCTTGLPAMDFRITDNHVDPPGSEHLLSEELVRLNRCYCCYELPRPLPKPGPLPALERGYVTFGCFQRPQKLSAELLRMWSAILLRLPRSRILFHHLFDGKATREPILTALGRHGVAASRVRFAGYRPGPEHLATIASTDIALDSFPYHGMTTTCDSVAMGVPVVTLAGRSHVSRAGVSILHAVGLADWIAPDGQTYIETTLSRARDLAALASLRASLPRRVRESPLTDGPDFAKTLEQVYRDCCRRTEGKGSTVFSG